MSTVVGVVELQVFNGQDPNDRHWGWPLREHWGLSCHRQLSLALADRLAFTVIATGSGSVEPACRRRQCRFKQPGQFWTLGGRRRLGALSEARHSLHREELWPAN